MRFEDQTTPVSDPTTDVEGSAAALQSKGNHNEGFNVFGVVTSHDIEILEGESRTVFDRRRSRDTTTWTSTYSLTTPSATPPHARACGSPSRNPPLTAHVYTGPLTAVSLCTLLGAT